MRILLALCVAFLGSACASLQDRTAKRLETDGPGGTRWGLVVTTMDGRELVAIRPDERFMPASNTKLFTVAAAFERLGDMSIPDPTAGASIRFRPNGDKAPDIILVGGGDAMLIDAPDCARDCLSYLADAIVGNRMMRLGDIVGDDTLFPDQRWGEGWSQEDLIFRSGAPASALVINSNELRLDISPGAVGDAPKAAWREGDQYFALVNEALTVAGDKDELKIERPMGSGTVRLFGTIGAGVAPQGIPMAVEDPALVAAWRLKRLLEARGVVVEGAYRAVHRPVGREAVTEGAEIARLLPPPLIEDVSFQMKQSQNQHAEILLRRVGRAEGAGSVADGLAEVRETVEKSGARDGTWDLFDGSGMSVYNRVTPRMVAGFLRWTAGRPWGAAYRDTLPVGGVDGTLRRRFGGTSLEGRIFAKTGTLTGVNALSGFMLTRSGEMLVFSAYANDRPSQAGSAVAALDAALVAIAEER